MMARLARIDSVFDNEYHFVDRWFVPGSVQATYELLGDTHGYPTWWAAVFVKVEGGEGKPYPGRRATIVSRGKLPYLLRWVATIEQVDEPRSFSFTMTGDFVGRGNWTFEEADGGTHAIFDFRPRAEKPVVKQLSPFLKPLFAWNHRWAMARGEKGARERMRRPRGERLPNRVEPVR